MVIGHFLLRPCAIIRPLRIYQQLNGLCRTNIKEVMALSKVNFTTRWVPAAEAAPVCPKTRFFRLIWQALTISYAAIIEWACCCQYRPPHSQYRGSWFFPLFIIYIYKKSVRRWHKTFFSRFGISIENHESWKKNFEGNFFIKDILRTLAKKRQILRTF